MKKLLRKTIKSINKILSNLVESEEEKPKNHKQTIDKKLPKPNKKPKISIDIY